MNNAFELSHILFLVVALSLSIASLIVIKLFCKSQNSKNIVINVVAVTLFATLIWNRLSVAILNENMHQLIPDSFCTISALLLSTLTLILFKNRNHKIFHCVVYIAFIGGLVTIIYPVPAFANTGTIFEQRTFSMLVFHTLMSFLAVLLIVTGEFKPNFRNWWCMLLGMCAYLTFGHFLAHAFNVDIQMEIYRPFVPNTILEWYVVGPLSLVIMLIISISCEYLPKLRKNSDEIPETESRWM
ncbi:MAG: YwaF family protein [Firmicutes bacterium]|nr:YwaF family protein [Bacillota bacterium]